MTVLSPIIEFLIQSQVVNASLILPVEPFSLHADKDAHVLCQQLNGAFLILLKTFDIRIWSDIICQTPKNYYLEGLNMQCLMDHIVLNVKNDERMIDFYSKVIMLAPERLEEFRAGEVPFPSVRLNSDTIIDLFPKKMWQKIEVNEGGCYGFR